MNFFDFHHHDADRKSGIYNLKFNEEAPGNFFSAGIHPNAVSDDFDEKLIWLQQISAHENCVAIGECGLDGLIGVDEELQRKAFFAQIEIANSVKKPLIIHCVKRFSQIYQFRKLAKVPMIIHGFNKRKTIGDDLLKNGFCLSFGKSVLYNVNLQDFVKHLPIEKLFLETDSADFEIKELYQKVADLKNMRLEDLSEKIKNNLQNMQIPI
ncbi:TatD family hydrolase [Kaistella faecalis]|uniref:TatD family hydrolase n=1 Tax=Kaistella faecalis TaxID=2852098 RepID=UPI001C472ACF|nr:TatD family hydrolase [Chryseobacterium faecale]UFK96807.1 TatD family hydrolase [Chryseobacterium faecale]